MDEYKKSMERRLKRERQARKQAENLLTEKSAQLYHALTDAQQARKKLELALWAAQTSFWEWHADTDLFKLEAFTLDGNNKKTWQGSPTKLMRFVHRDDIASLQFLLTTALYGTRDRIEATFRFRTYRGYHWMRLRGRVLSRGESQEALRLVGITRDISSEVDAQQSFQLLAAAFASSKEPMVVLSHNLDITEANEAFAVLMQVGHKDGFIGRSLGDFLHIPDDMDVITGTEHFESTVLTHAGNRVAVDVSLTRFEEERNKAPYFIGTLRDISERKKHENRLRQQALHDDLTGLLNRSGLDEILNSLVAKEQHCALLFIDLDGFKQVNDTAGHEYGDACLKKVAAELTKLFSEQAWVARWGGTNLLWLLLSQSKALDWERH